MHLPTRWYHIFFVLLLTAAAGCTAQGNFGSNREPDEGDQVLSRQPVEVTLMELDAAPLAFVNRFIRVSGEFRPPADPLCNEVRGPAPLWALVEGELHLQATGFNTILNLVPEGTMLTVEGFWRLYDGPAGCGKEPSDETIWYLEAIHIVEPNPLPQFDLVAADEAAVQEEGAGTGTPTATPTGTPTPTPTEGTPTITPTADPLLTPSPSPEASVTPTPTVTAEEGEPTATEAPDETPEPSPTSPSGVTPTSPAPTDTPGSGGYPPPPPTDAPPGY